MFDEDVPAGYRDADLEMAALERTLRSRSRVIRVDPDVKRMLDAERRPSDPNYSVVIRRLLRRAA